MRSAAALLTLLLACPARAEEATEAYASSARLFDGVGLKAPQGPLRGFRGVDPATGLEIEAGDLGATAGGTLLGSSPYLSIGKSGSGSGKYLDWGLRGRVSVVDRQSRYFSSVPPVGLLLRDGADPPAFSSQQLYVLSVIGNVGRAYNLYGPVDVGWSMMSMLRMDHIFPSAAFDQSVGARLRLNGGHAVGLFGGVTETVALLSEQWATNLVIGEKTSDARMVTAPHAEVGAWGPLPIDGGAYRVFAGMQKNPLTDLIRLEGTFLGKMEAGILSAGLRAEKEAGSQIEFNRDQRALRLALAQRGGVEWSVEAGKRNIGYGGASYKNDYVMLGMAFHEQVSGRSLSVSAVSASGELSSPAPAWPGQVQKALSDGVSRLDGLMARASAVLNDASNGADTAKLAQGLREAYAALPFELRFSLDKEVGGAPDFERLARERAAKASGTLADVAALIDSERAKLAQLQAALSDPNRLERIVTRYLRVQIYEAIQGSSVRLWGRDTPLTPGLLLAGMHAYGMGLSMVAPVPAGALGPALDAYLAQRLSQRFGISCAGGDLVGCALAGLPPELRARLESLPADKAREFIAETLGIAGETIRIEANRFLLSLYVSAKQFDALTVERGETLGVVNRQAVMDSFARLDERRERERESEQSWRETSRAAFDIGARRLAAETEEQTRRLQALLAERGARLSAELSQAGIEAAPNDLARLVGGYGEDTLRAFAAAAKDKLVQRGAAGLSLRCAESVAIIRGDKSGRLILNVPPASGREPGKMLDALVLAL